MDKNFFLEESLVQFFYKNLNSVNRKSICPLPHEFILYTCEVLNKYVHSETFFTNKDGKMSEKVLGINFLEAAQKSQREKKQIYKSVGDTVLVQLGIFPRRFNAKHVPRKYYLHLGKSAYANMESLDCSFYDIPNFYNLFSTSFEYIVKLLTVMTQLHHYDSFEQYILNSPEQHSKLFITPNNEKEN